MVNHWYEQIWLVVNLYTPVGGVVIQFPHSKSYWNEFLVPVSPFQDVLLHCVIWTTSESILSAEAEWEMQWQSEWAAVSGLLSTVTQCGRCHCVNLHTTNLTEFWTIFCCLVHCRIWLNASEFHSQLPNAGQRKHAAVTWNNERNTFIAQWRIKLPE